MRRCGDAFDFDEPFRTADCALYNHRRDTWKALVQYARHSAVIRRVAQIDDEVLHVVQLRPARAKKRVDVDDGPIELLHHIADMQDVAFVIDARRAGNEMMRAIRVGDARAALEGDVVVFRGAQHLEIVEEGHLLRLRSRME